MSARLRVHFVGVHLGTSLNLYDVMTRLGEAAKFDTVESEVMEVEGIRVSVATPKALYRLKKDTVRPLDRQDAETLKQQFDLGEE